jgi:hypothetical protein
VRLALRERPTRAIWICDLIKGMNSFEAMIADAVEISTMGSGHFRLMPGEYRVMPEKNGGALLVRIDINGTAPIPLTPVQWGILDAARFIKRR